MSGFFGLLFPGPSSGGGGGPSEYIAFARGPGGLNVYPWNNSTGFGSIYSNPTTSIVPLQVSFVPDNSNVSASFVGFPYFYVWQWSALGFGTLYSNSSSALNPSTGGPAGYTWTPSIDAFLSINATGPTNPQAWAWSPSTGFGTKYSNGSTISTAAKGITLNGDGSLAAVSIVAASPNPTIAIYPWSSSIGFGTRFANPTTLPDSYTQYSLTASFNKVTNDVIFGKFLSNFVTAYPVTSSGFGTKYADPTTTFGGQPTGLKFSPDGATIAASTTASVPVTAFSWGAGFGTKYSNPVSAPFYGAAMDWENTTKAIAFSNKTALPFSSVYNWGSAGFGAKYSDPAMPPNAAQAVSFSNQAR